MPHKLHIIFTGRIIWCLHTRRLNSRVYVDVHKKNVGVYSIFRWLEKSYLNQLFELPSITTGRCEKRKSNVLGKSTRSGRRFHLNTSRPSKIGQLCLALMEIRHPEWSISSISHRLLRCQHNQMRLKRLLWWSAYRDRMWMVVKAMFRTIRHS